MIYASRLEYSKKRSKQHDWSKGNALKKSLPGRQKAELMNLIMSLFPAASFVPFREKKKVVHASLGRVRAYVFRYTLGRASSGDKWALAL